MRTETSLQWKLLKYLLTFVIGLIVLLLLFQVVFLDKFYQDYKVDNIKKVANAVSMNIDSEQFNDVVDQQARQNDACIRVISGQDTQSNNYMGCQINRLGVYELIEYYGLAKENGGSYLQVTSEKIVNVLLPSISMFATKDGSRDLIYVKLMNTETDNPVMIMVNTHITPINATTETLRIQLTYITVIVIIASILLAWLISRKIVKPIVKINSSAQELAQGNYDTVFEGRGYKEVTQLTDTMNYAAVKLKEVDQMRRDLIANVSHDLRTPLTMISGYGEMMRDLPGENNAENVQVIIDEAHRLSDLVNDLLDLSKLQENKIELDQRPFNLTLLLKEVLHRYEKFIEQDNFDIQLVASQDVWVSADRNRLAQVLYNFINNAINYSQDNKQILIRQQVVDKQVIIEVVDHGEGIEVDKLEYIWDRYYKIDKTHKRSSTGSGIGLSIVKQILDLHHAQFGVRSQLDEGSVFWFQLDIYHENLDLSNKEK